MTPAQIAKLEAYGLILEHIQKELGCIHDDINDANFSDMIGVAHDHVKDACRKIKQSARLAQQRNEAK